MTYHHIIISPEYIDLYLDFIYNSSCSLPYGAFKSGFDTIMSGSSVNIFNPKELEELVCGSQIFDFNELESVAQYGIVSICKSFYHY